MQHDVERLVLFPYEIETELAGIGILELHLLVIIGSYLGKHLIQCDIVENNGLRVGCRVRLDSICRQCWGRLGRIWNLYLLGRGLYIFSNEMTHNVDGGKATPAVKRMPMMLAATL